VTKCAKGFNSDVGPKKKKFNKKKIVERELQRNRLSPEQVSEEEIVVKNGLATFKRCNLSRPRSCNLQTLQSLSAPLNKNRRRKPVRRRWPRPRKLNHSTTGGWGRWVGGGGSKKSPVASGSLSANRQKKRSAATCST
jgi:hypothetical protein